MTTDAKQSLPPEIESSARVSTGRVGKWGWRAPTSPKAIPVSPAGQFGSAVMSLFKLANSTSCRHPRFRKNCGFLPFLALRTQYMGHNGAPPAVFELANLRKRPFFTGFWPKSPLFRHKNPAFQAFQSGF